MIAEIALGIAGCCAMGGAWWAGHQSTDFKLNGMRRLTIPIDAEAGTEATLLLPWEMDERDYGQFLDVLFAMQRGLVNGPVPEPPERLPDDREPQREPTRLDAQRQHEAEVMDEAAQEEPYHGAHPFGRGGRRR